MTTRGDAEQGYAKLAEDGYYDLPEYPQARKRRCCQTACVVLAVVGALALVGLIAGAGYVFWPVSPDVEVKEWKLNGISMNSEESESFIPSYQLNVSIELMLQIANPNYAGVKYDNLTVLILYRGVEIGEVQSEGVSIKARSTVNFTATVNLEGKEILENVKDLLVDYSKRELPLTTYTTIDGAVQLYFFKPLIQVPNKHGINVSCAPLGALTSMSCSRVYRSNM